MDGELRHKLHSLQVAEHIWSHVQLLSIPGFALPSLRPCPLQKRCDEEHYHVKLYVTKPSANLRNYLRTPNQNAAWRKAAANYTSA